MITSRVGARYDLSIEHRETMRKSQRGVLGQERLDRFGIHLPVKFIGCQDHHDIGAFDGVRYVCNLQAVCFRLGA